MKACNPTYDYLRNSALQAEWVKQYILRCKEMGCTCLVSQIHDVDLMLEPGCPVHDVPVSVRHGALKNGE